MVCFARMFELSKSLFGVMRPAQVFVYSEEQNTFHDSANVNWWQVDVSGDRNSNGFAD